MTIKSVVIDLDGTLSIFNLDYKTVRAEVRVFLIKTGVPSSVLSVNESIFEMLKKTELFFKNNDKPEKIEKTRNKALKIAEKYELEAAKNTSLLPGAMETLKILKKMNLKIGLCTINSKKSMDYILEKFGLNNFFNATIPRNKVKNVKPNPEHLEAVLKALGDTADKVIVVGDGCTDMKCAKELKALAVGLSTGVSSIKQLISCGANYIITSIIDLPVLIAKINKNFKT